ncbi:Hsp20/alpha crystallin family protein [Patescibacteria group bacterium]
MTKQKKSFMERLTGSKKIEEMEEENLEHMNVASEDTAPVSIPASPELNYDESSDQNWMTNKEEADDDGQLTIDVYQTDTEVVIKSTIAGVKPEDLDVSINNDMVVIKGERTNEEEIKEEDFYYQECYWGSFSRSIVLPVDVLSEKAEASLKNGILTLRLPKAETNKIKKIQVRGF